MGTTNLKVTIMIPTYEQEEYILESVNSALSQTYSNLEVIVSDDSVTDKTKDILTSIVDHRFKYFKNKKNLGRVANYRKLLYEYASGDYVINLDGDDYYIDNNYISDAVLEINKQENVVIVSAGQITDYCNSLKKYNKLTNKVELISGKQQFMDWRSRPLPHMTCLYNRKIALEIGFYVQDIQSTDWESLMRLCKHGNVVLLPQFVGTWRKHGNNISMGIDIKSIKNNDRLIGYVLKHWKDELSVSEQEKWSREIHRLMCQNVYHTIIENGRLSEIAHLVDVYGIQGTLRMFLSLRDAMMLLIRIFFGIRGFALLKRMYLGKIDSMA